MVFNFWSGKEAPGLMVDTSGFLWKPFLKVDRVDWPEKKTLRSHLLSALHLTAKTIMRTLIYERQV